MTLSAHGQVATRSKMLELHLHQFGASRSTLHTMVTLWPRFPHLFADNYDGRAWQNDWDAIQEVEGLDPAVYFLTQRVPAKNLREVSEFITLMSHWAEGPETVLDILDAVNPTWRDGYDHVAALILLRPTAAEARQWAATGTVPSLDDALTLLALAHTP